MPELTGRQTTARFLFVGLVVTFAAWGMQFLPPDDYRPSRPLYASGWLIASLVAYLAIRKRGEPWRSALLILLWIFVALLALSFIM
jgi:hypothetical protein